MPKFHRAALDIESYRRGVRAAHSGGTGVELRCGGLAAGGTGKGGCGRRGR